MPAKVMPHDDSAAAVAEYARSIIMQAPESATALPTLPRTGTRAHPSGHVSSYFPTKFSV
eukprot:4370366-Prymnesium_polylepis.1